jgi:hypothetical protein
MRALLVLVAAGCLPASAALAEPVIPRFDVEQHCEAVASFGGTYSAMMDRACMQQEQGAYDGLKPQWPDLPETVRAHCTEVAAFGGPGSYLMLESCVHMELDAMEEDGGFKY